MTRDHAIAAIHGLMVNLPPEEDLDARAARLLERVASHADAEVLRAALVEVGVHALLWDSDNARATHGEGQALTSGGRA